MSHRAGLYRVVLTADVLAGQLDLISEVPFFRISESGDSRSALTGAPD